MKDEGTNDSNMMKTKDCAKDDSRMNVGESEKTKDSRRKDLLSLVDST